MNKYSLAVILITLLLSCEDSKKTNVTSDEGADWIALFDGSNTNHWRGIQMEHFPDSGWAVVDGELMNDGTGKGGLLSKDEYANFQLEWEWRLLDKGGNSGLKYFVKEKNDGENKSALGLEYQMLDDEGHSWMLEGKMKPNDYHTTGALYEFFNPSDEKKMKPLGEFNKSKIVSKGNHVEHWLNGKKIVEYERGGEKFMEMKSKSKFSKLPEFGLYDEGHLLLQDHSSRVGFRNIRIKILE